MQLKRLLRLIALALMIGLACVMPVPMNLFRKDDLPKHTIEQVDLNEDDDDDQDIKELF